MDWDGQKKLERTTRVGKEVWMNARETGIPTVWGVVEDEVGIVTEDAKHVIQRVRLANGVTENGEKYGYKIGSFVMDALTGSVRWAPYSQMLLESECRELLALAKSKGWPVL